MELLLSFIANREFLVPNNHESLVTGQSLQPRVAFLPGPVRLLSLDNPGPPFLLPQRFPHSCSLIIQRD